jgi:hypothetical protein
MTDPHGFCYPLRFRCAPRPLRWDELVPGITFFLVEDYWEIAARIIDVGTIAGHPFLYKNTGKGPSLHIDDMPLVSVFWWFSSGKISLMPADSRFGFAPQARVGTRLIVGSRYCILAKPS